MFGGRWRGELWAGSGRAVGKVKKSFFLDKDGHGRKWGPVRKRKCGRGSRFCKNVDWTKTHLARIRLICTV